jgi:hypothetical protein
VPVSDRRIDGLERSAQGHASPLFSRLFDSQVRSSAQDGDELYMLLDAARDQRIYARLTELGERVHARSLYQGDVGDSLAHVSPYLLALQQDRPDSLWFAEAGFGRSWGVFVTGPIGFDELRRHLRKFNIVYRENGTPLVFRFYDPRVLRRFLPSCTLEELRRFFGPVGSFLTETAEADSLLRFALNEGELLQTRLLVRAQA